MHPEEIVNRTEAAYQSEDVDRIMELMDPAIVWYWNGWKKADGLEGVRKAHEEFYQSLEEFQIEKSLRAASGETIAVEWESTATLQDGSQLDGYGGEFWTIRDDRLREWHAYSMTHNEDQDPVFPGVWDGPEMY